MANTATPYSSIAIRTTAFQDHRAVTPIVCQFFTPDSALEVFAPSESSKADASVPVTQSIDFGYSAVATATVTFDGATHRIICDSGTLTLDVVGVYSEWVDWALTGNNLRYDAAFAELGGNTIDAGAGTSVPVYGFLVNSWKVAPDEADHTLAVTGGILLVSGGGDPFNDTAGAYTVRINYQQPVQAITVSTAGGGGASAADVWSYATRKLTGTKQSLDDLNDVSASDVRTEIDANSTKLDVAVSTRMAASSYSDPWQASLPGSYTGDQAGNIIGAKLLTIAKFLGLK